MSARSHHALCGQAEHAGLHASATSGQFWLDGWLIRLSPDKAKRSRCVNAFAPGVLPLDQKLQACARLFARAGLPLILRLTPYSQPPGLDAALEARGWHRFDDTRVLLLPEIAAGPGQPMPAALSARALGAAEFAQTIGALRGTPAATIAAHARRLADARLRHAGWVWSRGSQVLACGQYVREGACVGLYDVFVDPVARNRGLAQALCADLLGRARAEGARTAYLQVDADNGPALAAYRRLGFVDGYGYHYRSPDPRAA